MNSMNLTTPFSPVPTQCEDPRLCGGPQRHAALYHQYLTVMSGLRIAGPEELQAIIMGASRRDQELVGKLSRDNHNH